MERPKYRPIRNAVSRFKGVTRHGNRWLAAFDHEQKRIRIGGFTTEEEAARAYDEAILLHRGSSAFCNARDLELLTQPIVEGESSRVPLASGEYFVVDTADLAAVRDYNWALSRRSICGKTGGRKVSLGHLLLEPHGSSHVIAHLNANILDYRRSNLGLIPRSLLAGRNRKATEMTSVYKGVGRGSPGKWRARLAGKYLGEFRTEVEAAEAYDAAARRAFGIFAALNFPGEGEQSCLPGLDQKAA